MGESGGSAQRRAEHLRASGDAASAAWAAGAEGERRVAQALSALPEPWVVLHDRLLRPGLAESNLDHVVVGPAGVILVDAKNWGGNVTEWNGVLYQHRWDTAGHRSHEAKHSEVAKVHAMGREMATRLGMPVTPVLCLAGSRSAHFGEPQQIRGIWVVPVGRLVGWLEARTRVVDDDVLDRLSTLVMTEFPSTTTDPALLAAIGADLARAQRSTRLARPRRAGRAPAARPGRQSNRGRPARSTRGRRRAAVVRQVFALLGLAALWWMVTSGVIEVVSRTASDLVGRTASGLVNRTTSDMVTRTVTDAMAPTPTPARLSCADVDPRAVKALRAEELAATPGPLGCDWHTTDDEGRRMLALRLHELRGPVEALHPMLEGSADAGGPEVHTGYSRGGEATFLWVRAGIPISSTKGSATATRSIHVQVSHDLLGLSPKEGARVAASLAEAASGAAERLTEPAP
ncbi:hypothetical protein GCM10023168_14130 [Fodinibacter luteus]|uniref:NERD domain-containing protein n=1 Tax=Fodinibacter luteus TaxID=552064 RepID=A0ABP8KB14_9MICO